ncbi:MAG: caspase family protein [Planctomycetaceae bacterium]|nr:caspase family protein [Planctomycetaceae bacterium]
MFANGLATMTASLIFFHFVCEISPTKSETEFYLIPNETSASTHLAIHKLPKSSTSIGDGYEPFPSPSRIVERTTSLSSQRRVLMIGCGRYPNLPRDYQLQGPPNDVAITKELLQSERFAVPPENIATLVSGSDPQMEPTAANIRAAFEKLCESVRPNDQVLILLAGHGCQVPNLNPEVDSESDGLDEAFVPADISGWRERNPPSPPELILDDEIGVWLKRLVEAGARVFLIADCCHAGSIDRGPGEPPTWVRERRLPPIFAPTNETPSTLANSPRKDASDWEAPPEVISLFAVPAKYPELEDRMPPNSSGGIDSVHGRLTFALNQTLRQSRRALTYRELIQQVVWQYQTWNWNPRPYLEGSDLDREVLGMHQWPTRSWITATKETQRFRLNVGFLDQIAPGSVFELFAADRDNDSTASLGFLKVSRVFAGECLAEPCPFAERPAVNFADLPVGANAELVYRELGDARLPVGLIAATDETANHALWTSCEAALERLIADPRHLIRRPIADETPQLFVVVGATQAWIRPGTGSVEDFPDSGSLAYQPLINDETLERRLSGGLMMIARATNLVRLASPLPTITEVPSGTRRATAATAIEIQVLREMPRDSGNYVPVDDPATLLLENGDRIRIQIRNVSESRWDLTGLLVDSGYKIDAFNLGRNGTRIDHRLPPKSEPAYFQIKISNETYGLDHFVLIAVEAGAEPEVVNFKHLEQTGPEAARLVAKPVTRSAERISRFQQLIDSTTLDGATTRGPGRNDEPGIVVSIPWRVHPPENPSPTP